MNGSVNNEIKTETLLLAGNGIPSRPIKKGAHAPSVFAEKERLDVMVLSANGIPCNL